MLGATMKWIPLPSLAFLARFASVSALFLPMTIAQARPEAKSSPPVLTPEMVLKACATFDREPASKAGRAAAATILQFTDQSPKVLVIISPYSTPWMGMKGVTTENQALLLAAFSAGNIRAQLQANEVRDHPYDGWMQVFRTYAKLKAAHPKLSVPPIEDLISKRDAGTLRAHEKEVEQRHAAARGFPRA